MKKRNTSLWGLMLVGCLLSVQAISQTNVNMPYNTGVFSTFTLVNPQNCTFFNFFDNGGAAGLYSNSSNPLLSVVTFAPAVPGNKVRAQFTSFATEASFDALYIYDGTLASVPNILNGAITTVIPGQFNSGQPLNFTFRAGGWQGAASPGTIQASAGNATGALTFQFNSDGSVQQAGWVATIVEVAAGACAMTAPANISTGTGPGDTDCAADVLTALPVFNPAGCNAALTLRYRVNGGAPIVVPQPLPGTLSLTVPTGVNTITWELVDLCFGAVAASANQIITVVDNTPPALNCPASVTFNLGPGACTQVFSYAVTATDNCPTTGFVSSTADTLQTGNSGISCNAGIFTPIDNYVYKVLTGFGANSNLRAARVRIATDFFNVPASITVRIYRLTNPAQPYNVTAANRTLIATSATVPVPVGFNGQRLHVPFNGEVVPAGSTILMEVFCNYPFVIGQFEIAGGGNNTWIASPPCGIDPNNPGTFASVGFPLQDIPALLYFDTPLSVVQTAGLPPGSEFPIGTTTNCYSATDAAGNVSTCCFDVTVLEFPNPIASLACNDLVQISLDETCTAVVNADQVLEGGPYGCYDNYIVELDKVAPFGNGPWVPAVLGPGDVGKTYQYRVTDPATNNKCWGNLRVEDKLAPVLDCTNAAIACNANPAPGGAALNVNINAGTNFAIAAAGASTANINIAQAGVINNITVVFRTDHTWVGDINGRLTSPSGTSIQLWNYPGAGGGACGGCAGDGMDVVFDDAATLTHMQFMNTCGNLPAIAGTFQPADPLAAFNGEPVTGTWTLNVNDGCGGDGGPNSFIQLIINATVPPPAFPNGLVLNQTVFSTGQGCYNVPIGAGTPVLESCSNASLCYLDTEVTQNCASGFTKTISRKWTATDASGNTATCIQTINLLRPTIGDVEYPPSYDDIDEPALSCGGTFPTPDYLEGIGLQGYPYVFGQPDGCSIGWTYEDAIIGVCDGTYKIRRKWVVVDWCTGDDEEYNQIIKVLDDEGPTFTCPANITVGTDPFTCCATVDLPNFIATDNCSRITNISAMVTTFDPQTNQQLNMYTVGGTLTDFPGNNYWDRDTMVNVGLTPCLPIGTHTVVYTLSDQCGNTTTCSFRVTVRDLTPPVAACDEFTIVGIGVDDPFDCYEPADSCNFAGVTWVKATTFDDGSYDNCGDIKFTIRRMAPYSDCILALNPINGHPICDPQIDPFPDFPSEFERGIGTFQQYDPNWFYEGADSIKFYCCEVGTTQTIILAVYQLDVNGQPIAGPDGQLVRNECMIQVEVQDKLKPICQGPANVSVSCENFDPSLWAYGIPAVYDNCCLDETQSYQGQCGLTHSVNYGLFDTVCNKGTITRTFRVFDCHGQSNQCTQRIFVNYEQDYWLKFPNDVIVSVCDGTGNYGEPEFFGEDCELLGVSFEDEIFTVVPDACYKIERTWTVINWCTYNPNLGCINVPNPNPNPAVNHPSNLTGVTVSPAGTPQPWNPTVVAIAPGQTPTNYSTFWDANANCYKYKQIIKVIDNQAPVVDDCPASPVEVNDLTANDPLFWNQMYWWDNTIESHDLCEAPTDLCITATDLCSGSNISIRYLLFLDLDGDGTMETVINSVNTGLAGLGWNAVPYGNGNNPNYTGGTIRQFDNRPVLPNQKYGFAIQTTVSGNDKTACVRWNTQQSQNTYVVPELPYGTHKIKWFVSDGCGNEAVCEYTFIVKDGKKPTVVCINGLSVNIMPTKMVSLWDTDFLQYTEDNCTPSNRLVTAIRKSGQGTGFPLNPDGTPQKSVTFTCDELGTQLVELWSRDLAGNADYCETYVIVQDNMNNCSNTSATVAGALKTEANKGLEDATVALTGSHPALPPAGMFDVTDAQGNYTLGGIPLQGDYTVTPGKDNDPLNGVSTFDLVLINKHILGLEPLNTPYKMIAADANNSRSITTFDIVELRKLILGIYTELPNNTSWRFVDKSYTFPNANNPFQTIFPETKQIAQMLQSMDDEDFVSVKVGDVNGNAVTSSLTQVDDRTAGTLLFDVEDRAVKAGETFTVNFKAAEKVQGYQFTLNYNNLELLDVVPGANMKLDNFGVFQSERAVTTSFDGDVQGEFALTFRATANGTLSQLLGVSSRITKSEAYNAGNERLEVAFRFNGATGSTIAGLGFELYQNQPNPFINKTQIGFYLPEAATATLTIFNEAGQMVFTQKGDYAKGYNAVTIDRAVLNTTGVLYYKLETATNSATKKMIQTK